MLAFILTMIFGVFVGVVSIGAFVLGLIILSGEENKK